MTYNLSAETMDLLGSGVVGSVLGGALGALTMAALITVAIIGLALYVYQALAWMVIAKKLKHKYPWLAWIPFAATSMRLQLGGFHWAWTFLWLIPILGWIPLIVLLTISMWRIFPKRGVTKWLGLAYAARWIPKISGIGLITYLITIGFVAWKKK